jgi:hypothetical protein
MKAPPNKHRFLPRGDGKVACEKCGALMDEMWKKFRSLRPTAFQDQERLYVGTILLRLKERLINAHFNCLNETEATIRNIIC